MDVAGGDESMYSRPAGVTERMDRSHHVHAVRAGQGRYAHPRELARYRVHSFGIAGGLAPHLAAGDWVVASGVRTQQGHFPTDRGWARALLEALPSAVHAEIIGADAPIAEPVEKRQLHLRTGAVAVDTESHVAARIAAAHRIPFAACRAVIDPAHSLLPPAAVFGLRHDGTADVIKVLRSVMRQPSQLPALARTALDARTAGAALRRGRRLLGAGLGFPYFEELALDANMAVEMR